jgi:hypothetical protein
MGYRNYIGVMPKKEYNTIKSLTLEEFLQFYDIKKDESGYWHKGVYSFGKELYEFGKYVDFEPPKKSMRQFFKKKEMAERYNDDELFIVTPEFLEYIIGTYKKSIQDYYNKMVMPFFNKRDDNSNREEQSTFLDSVKTVYMYPDNKYSFDFTKITDEEQSALYDIIKHVRDMRIEWTSLRPFDLTTGDEVTTSWKYEYSIFELVRIYKSFDWKKNVMIYYGY